MLSWQLMTNVQEYQEFINNLQRSYEENRNKPKYLSKIWKKEYGMEIDE